MLWLFLCQLKSCEGRADCARPILWAAETKKLVDTFIIFTDQPCGTCSSVPTDDAVTPVQALRQYCEAMSHPNTRYDSALNVITTLTQPFLAYCGINLTSCLIDFQAYHFLVYTYTQTSEKVKVTLI